MPWPHRAHGFLPRPPFDARLSKVFIWGCADLQFLSQPASAHQFYSMARQMCCDAGHSPFACPAIQFLGATMDNKERMTGKRCECTLDCDHHKGKPCNQECVSVPRQGFLDGKGRPGPPVYFKYCLKCLARH